MTFDEAFERVIGHEGGYSDTPQDRGNWTGGAVGVGLLKGTKYGVAAHVYPDLDIKNLTLDQAKAIYRRDYWDRIKGDALPAEVRFDVFDTAVNSGVGTATRLMQRALGVKEDGIIGPQTLAAITAHDPCRFLAKFNGHRLMHMTGLGSWPHFSKSWTRRVARNLIG